MQPTKLVFIVLVGLAMVDFFIAQSSNAAVSAKAPKPSLTATRRTAKPTNPMKGLAVVYSDKMNGRKTASGQVFHQSHLTAAHRSLPFGTKVRVTNIRNHKSVEVHINDRWSSRAGRVIDLSSAAAAKVGMRNTGSTPVKLEVVRAQSAKKV